ncbi:MAG: hypothetical protein ACR2K6_07045 [Solirubrobacterales bacterium]
MERGSEVQTSEGKAKAGVGARVGAAFGALLLAFLAAVAVIAMADIGSLTPCEDIGSDASLLSADGECFDGSSTRQTLTLIVGWPGAALAVASVLLAIAFVVRGRGGRLAIGAILAGALLFGLSILVGSI